MSRPTRTRRGAAASGELERLLTPKDVSVLVGVPVETLYQWRRRRTGPKGFRVGRHLRYYPADVRVWLAELRAGVG